MRIYILVFISAIIIQSCNSPQKQVETSDSTTVTDSATAVDSSVTAITKTPVVFKGLYTFGHEVRTFRDCSGSQTVYWVNDSIANMRDKYESTNRFPSYPYESVYVEVKGYLSGKSSLGYASEYENVLVVTEIIKVEPKNFRTECYNYEFIALGNEPFWSVDIIPDEKRIVLKEVGIEKVREFPYVVAKGGENEYHYETTNAAKDKLTIVIRQEQCSDGMSDRKYKYSAEVTVNGTMYKGCAIKKGDVFTDAP